MLLYYVNSVSVHGGALNHQVSGQGAETRPMALRESSKRKVFGARKQAIEILPKVIDIRAVLDMVHTLDGTSIPQHAL